MSGGNDAWQIKSVFFKVHFAIAFRKTYLVETPVRIWSSIDEISSAWWLIVISFEEGNSQCALPDFSGTGLSILSLFWLGAIWQEGKTWIIFFERERLLLAATQFSLPTCRTAKMTCSALCYVNSNVWRVCYRVGNYFCIRTWFLVFCLFLIFYIALLRTIKCIGVAEVTGQPRLRFSFTVLSFDLIYVMEHHWSYSMPETGAGIYCIRAPLVL